MEHLILLIDDDDDEAPLLELALEYCSYPTQVQQVTTFEQVVQFLDDTVVIPSLIFLDLRMPVHNGWEILHWLRTHQRVKDVPIVMWSHTVNQADVDASYQQGASFFLPKTADRDLIRRDITEICARWLA